MIGLCTSQLLYVVTFISKNKNIFMPSVLKPALFNMVVMSHMCLFKLIKMRYN